jgi:hypothetical protein
LIHTANLEKRADSKGNTEADARATMLI